MSLDLGSPSGNSDRSLPAFNRTRDTSSSSGQAKPSAADAKSTGRSDPPRDQDLESFLHETPARHQTLRSNKNEVVYHGTANSANSRSSGGFLLDPAVAPSRLSFLSRSKNNSINVNGKPRRNTSGLVVSKRKHRDSHRLSVGSSPLATKVSTVEEDADLRAVSPIEDGSDLRPPGICTGRDVNVSMAKDKTEAKSSTLDAQIIGYDTDPMQIVNLALSLSEGRRRQVSGIRLASGESGMRRTISTGIGTNLPTSRAQSSLGQYLHSGRQFSRNISPQAAQNRHVTPVKTYATPSGTISNYLQPIKIDEADLDSQDLCDVSQATRTRVQKAKEHFELLYEHRRLLAHLPPLRTPKQQPRKPDAEGRAYNPLQYARNRKVRFPPKKLVESDSEGWNDIQNVRSWVNAIIEGHTGRRTDPDECIRLPGLDHLRSETKQENQDPTQIDAVSSIKEKRDLNQGTQSRRHRSDWVISPGDLLADVYWLEQGLNKTKIEDRDGNKIYSWNTELKYTGWRNRTPAHGQGSQQSSHSPEPKESGKPMFSAPAAPPELPTFTSAGRKEKHRGRGRRREAKTRNDSESEKSDSGARTGRKRLRKSLIRSISRSSTSDSDDERSVRPRKRIGKEEHGEPPAEGGALDQYIRKMLDHDGIPLSQSLTASKPRSSIERSRSTTKTPSGGERTSSRKRRESYNRLESMRVSLDKRRHSRPSLDFDEPTRPSLDYDTTAPSSPSIHQFPSIAINLSPPPSRSPSPTKKALHSRINPFRDRDHVKQRNGIDNFDFADPPLLASERRKSSEKEKEPSLLHLGSRDPSPMTKNASRSSDTSFSRDESRRTNSTASKTSAKVPYVSDNTSRIRGIFKGGRIAELVGNEVSRVGDFIWKREVPAATHTSSSASSTKSFHGSDNDEEVRANGNVLKKSPQPNSSRFSTSTNSNGKNVASSQPRSAGMGDKTTYFMSNLPSFTSPFQKDREVQEERDRAVFLTPESSPPNPQRVPDHISQAAAHHRSLSKSTRFDRLAPPKLNTSRPPSRVGSPEGHQGSYDLSRNSSFTGPKNASRGLNDALSGPDTGLAGLKASRSGTELTRSWDPSARRDTSNQRTPSTTITRKDIARARALLLTSGTKALQLALQAHAPRPYPSQYLLATLPPPPPSSSPPFAPPRIPTTRKDEPHHAALNLLATLTRQSTHLQNMHLTPFTQTTIPTLHTSLQALSDHVDHALVPRVRAAADDAADLSVRLSTTSTLAVKGLNEGIEQAMRRRRRRGPVRWLKRFGYGIVEWLVVGLLWGIWLVVSVSWGAVGLVKGVWALVRWLLWLG